MKAIIFEWDPDKERVNISKHGVSFEEAVSAFDDEYAILFDDPDHSIDEERMLLIGFSARARLLIVSHCLRASDEVIRIISARKATKREANQYQDINRTW